MAYNYLGHSTTCKFVGDKMKAKTRREIIEIWSNQEAKLLDSFCCPYCRDILSRNKEGNLYCDNMQCQSDDVVFDPKTGEVIE